MNESPATITLALSSRQRAKLRARGLRAPGDAKSLAAVLHELVDALPDPEVPPGVPKVYEFAVERRIREVRDCRDNTEIAVPAPDEAAARALVERLLAQPHIRERMEDWWGTRWTDRRDATIIEPAHIVNLVESWETAAEARTIDFTEADLEPPEESQ